MAVDAGVLEDLAQARRDRRVEEVDWFEKLYQVYLTLIAGLAVVLYASAIVGDDHVAVSSMSRVEDVGPAVIGIVAAVAIGAGLRSGARGGPMTMEAPFVQHVLLAPVDRDQAMRGPAVRLLTNAATIGGALGAMAGLVAGERLPIGRAGLVLGGAAGGAAIAATALGSAMVVGGRRLRMATANAVAVLLVGAAATDLRDGPDLSPASWFGHLALTGIHLDVARSGLAVGVTALVVLAGLRLVGGLSIERARHRAGLVAGLRLAVTRQELRTVVLLHRRLSQDRARTTPRFRVPRLPWPVVQRGCHGIARLPARRLLRMGLLAAVAVAAVAGARAGTVPLLVVAGLAMHAVALDAGEALAQETDHPDRWASFPMAPGTVLLWHLAAPAALLTLLAVPVVIAVGVLDPGALADVVAAAIVAPVAAVVGAAGSVVMPAFEPWVDSVLVPPEVVGMRMVARVLWPLGVTTLGLVPAVAGPILAQWVLLVVAGAAWWLSRRQPATW